MTLSIDSWRKDMRSSSERGYGVHWQKARHRFLLEHPLCVMCEANGHTTPADMVDHIKPHRGDRALFWDATNWQALCKMHHEVFHASLNRVAVRT